MATHRMWETLVQIPVLPHSIQRLDTGPPQIPGGVITFPGAKKSLSNILFQKQNISDKVFLTHSYFTTIRKENRSLTQD